ncbi:sensor histidine kinase [Aquibacillus sp. 3ASR75-11]|uniref:histidine kinase n=1 Tax=Terrihalobacillus insolitus TaxID=2950438 RepID=A0A9X3WQC1_9BACI|nr:sensor histidine kinase [Terrihalobacillus insolitus]MDC3423285.1 sensor histidine kinase [Terrihalobacillus insolitus]
MKVRPLPIQWKITILSFGIVLFSLLLGGFIIIGNLENIQEEELSKRTMITARTVAQIPEIQRYITEPAGWDTINPIVEEVRIINNTDYIVVLNMERRRYSHPIQSRLGTISKGEDEGAAFAEHTYTSLAKGEAGVAIRAFVPIMNENYEQVGVVIAGNLKPGFFAMLESMKGQIGIIMLLTLSFGIISSSLLARHMKDQMFNLEPHEIVRILVERTATFNAMREGVIAIDKKEIITVFNEKAKEMLGVTGKVIGKPIREVINDTRLPEVLHQQKPVFNQEIRVKNTNIMSNRVPITVNNEKVGALAIFQDRTEVTKLAEELTGVKAFVEALRVQNHEHMNKLHTIAGLIQLGNLENALNFVFQISEENEKLMRTLSKNIKSDSIIGLLLSKVSRGKELGIKVSIDQTSILEDLPPHIDQHNFVLILGNLIENAFTALSETKKEKKRIFVSVHQDQNECTVIVEDNGNGIAESDKNRIFNEGFTTKNQTGHGLGLYLVKNIVEKGHGKVVVDSDPNEGTSFILTFPMHRS